MQNVITSKWDFWPANLFLSSTISISFWTIERSRWRERSERRYFSIAIACRRHKSRGTTPTSPSLWKRGPLSLSLSGKKTTTTRNWGRTRDTITIFRCSTTAAPGGSIGKRAATTQRNLPKNESRLAQSFIYWKSNYQIVWNGWPACRTLWPLIYLWKICVHTETLYYGLAAHRLVLFWRKNDCQHLYLGNLNLINRTGKLMHQQN